MTILVEPKGKILYITINRSDRGNSLDPPTLVKLRESFIQAQRNDKIKVIILTGAGDKDFCTGIDVNAAKGLSHKGKINLANTAGDIATLIYFGKPTVVSVNGRAMGMGIVFATAADYRLIVENTLCQMPEVNFGAFPGASCIALMSRVCGISWTRKILMLGQPFTSQDALNANIIDKIVKIEEIKKKTKKIARALSLKNPINLKAIKYATVSMPDMNYKDSIFLETALANYALWDDPTKEFSELNQKYKINYKLTGNPNELLKDYENSIS